MSYAILFPGQGSQFVGMGADLFEVRADLLGEAADAVLGWSLAEMCLGGPEDLLTRTENAQPALYATAYALWLELAERLETAPAAGAGHSLGEYIALSASGALGFLDGLELVAARGRAMAVAADRERSGMAALIGGDLMAAEELVAARRESGGRLWVANINAPGQVVVAGGEEDLAWVTENAPAHGIRKAVLLKVAGAFHSPFMASAADDLAEAVSAVEFAEARFPVWANATARPFGPDVAAGLVAQLTAPVRFSESLVSIAAAGVDTFVHVGPGDVTAALARRSVEGMEPVVVSSLEDVDAAVERLSAA
ncbi:MAG: ACP S-malonyltransferase [Acidimicrobiia bacterium]